MKSFEFNEGDPIDLQKIARELFSDPDDPRSGSYRRILVRPRISWGRVAACCLIPTALALGLGALLLRLGAGAGPALAAALALPLLWLCANRKRAAICLVRIYQRYAPDSLRNQCRFEPSCSQYMVLCLEKYGLCRGLARGIGRLRRCNINGGGYDFP